MRRLSTAFLITMVAYLCACSPAVYTARAAPEEIMVSVYLPAGATIMAVHADPANPLHSFVEHVLIDCGLSVLSTSLLAGSLPAGTSRYVTSDTTVYRTERAPVYLRLFDEVKADYLLRYSYSGHGSAVYGFSASLIEPASGRLISSYGRTYLLAHTAEQAMEDFHRALRAALQR